MAVIIGTYYEYVRLYYDGRQQGKDFYADTLDAAKAKAEAHKQQLIKDYSGFPCYLYANSALWEIKRV